MSAAIAIPRITICPPGPQRRELTTEFFDKTSRATGRYPVSARAEVGEEVSTPGLAFEDYTRMSTHQHKQSGERRLPTPAWALQPDLLRAVVVHYVERRASIHKPQPGTERERLARASQKNTERCKRKEAILRKLCAEFVEVKTSGVDPVRAKRLAEEIKNLDTCLQVDRNIAGIALRVVNLYYSVGLDSVGVATEMGLKPPHVRVLIWKLNWVWDKLHGKAKMRYRQDRIPRIPKIKIRKIRSGKVDVERASEMIAAGKTYRELGILFGVAPSKVLEALKRAGLWKPKTKSSGIGMRTILKHVEIMRKLAANNGGEVPRYKWLNENGYFSSYEVRRMYPAEFHKAGLYKS